MKKQLDYLNQKSIKYRICRRHFWLQVLSDSRTLLGSKRAASSTNSQRKRCTEQNASWCCTVLSASSASCSTRSMSDEEVEVEPESPAAPTPMSMLANMSCSGERCRKRVHSRM